MSNKIKELNTTIFNSQSNEQIINFQISQLKQENITLKTNALNLSNEKNNYIIRSFQLQELLQNENNKYTKLENNYNQLKNEYMELKKKYELLKEESQIGFKADASNILSSPNKFKIITN